MAGEKFFLNFISDGFGRVEIDEPIGFNSLSFDFKQKDKGYGRDIMFNGGESQLEFTSMRNHYLEKLMYYNHHYGYESKVEIEIEFSTGLKIFHELDFVNSQTDDYEYFKCKMIQKSVLQVVKRREQVKVDLFSDLNIDKKPITPVKTTKILMKPKSIIQQSKWEQTEFKGIYMEAKGAGATKYFQANPCQIITQSDIKDTLTSLFTFEEKKTPSDYFIINAENQMVNTRLVISGINLAIHTGTANGGNGYVDFNFFVIYGKDEATGVRQSFISSFLDTDRAQSFTYTQPSDFIIDIPLLEKQDKIWVYFEWKVKESSSIGASPKSYCRTDISGMKMVVSSTTTSSFSVVHGVRLIDAIKQVVLSISGLNINAPIFDSESIYYNTFLMSGNMLRGLLYKTQLSKAEQKIDLPFYLSLDDIVNSMTECNGDYELNDTVFFGTERDFYTAEECGFFDTTQFHDFYKTFNERLSINEFIFKYENYQALKENELPQTADTVHGESTLTLFNKNVENKKDVIVSWIRDSFLIEEARSKALQLTEKTSYQEDDNVFAVDTIIQTSNAQYKETAELNHVYDPAVNRLTLKTDSLNFVLLGIEVGTYFQILPPHKNQGNYTVSSVTNNTVALFPSTIIFPRRIPAGIPNSNNDGIAITSFLYSILATNVPLTNYTTQGITNIDGINDPNSYSNLRFSVKRSIVTYYEEYLASCNNYWSDNPLITTWYKNNGLFAATYNGVSTLEAEDYIPVKKILSPNIYENVIFANVELDEFFTLQNNLRTKRGFIRTIDKNDNVIKLYPKNMNYQVMSKELTITAEEKFSPTQMSISTLDTDIMINDETSVHTLDYEIKNDKLYVYDSNRQLLYNGVFWDKVTINGSNPKSIAELDDLMKLIQSKNL